MQEMAKGMFDGVYSRTVSASSVAASVRLKHSSDLERERRHIQNVEVIEKMDARIKTILK